MFSFAMDSIFAISIGFALRLVVDTASHHNDRVGGSLVGLWEGAVLYHFLEKWPMSVDPYVGLGFRLFVDFLFTESVHRLAIVLLWTGLGFVLSDVTPAFWYDRNLNRFIRRTRRYIRNFDWSSLKLPIPTGAISRVRFYQLPPLTALGPTTSTTPAPPVPSQRRHSVPGNYSYSPSTSTSSPQPSSTPLRQPVPATSLPPSALRSATHPKPSSSSSVSFDVNPPASTRDDDDDSFEQLAADDPAALHTAPEAAPSTVPAPEPSLVTPLIIINPTAAPDLTRTLSGDPTSSTLTPGNIDLLPEILELRDDPDPPPPFDEPAPSITATVGTQQVRVWAPEKLSVRNPDMSDGGSARDSVISGGNRSSIINRADLLRMEAMDEEKERDRLHAEHKKAFSEKRYTDAVRYKVEQEEANERAMNLHRRAADRYFMAHNVQQQERTIDVHRLQTREATRRTEIAIRDALLAGDTRLRVICGRGRRRHSDSDRGLPVLRLALTVAMEQHKVETEVDPDNPEILIIKLPAS
ncbi:hypothetical protein F5148DRAFT_1270498 [Russula earlei]|uniref:Uncharacterized protein n=1 Tax=Russula earlei TaxID=71964 RepID=A0ACC0TRW1_9AGAM|nr:hypothetical protein F5148DRAFT_1270498 [Russula earlei]